MTEAATTPSPPAWAAACTTAAEWDAAVADRHVEPRGLPREASALAQQLEAFAKAVSAKNESEANIAEAHFRRQLAEFDAYVGALTAGLPQDEEHLELLAQWRDFLLRS